MRARKGKPPRRCRDRASCRTSVLLASSAFLRSSRSFCSSSSTFASTSASDSSSASGRSAVTSPFAACASASGCVCRIEVGGKGERARNVSTKRRRSRWKGTRDRRGGAREIARQAREKAGTPTSTLTSAMVAEGACRERRRALARFESRRSVVEKKDQLSIAQRSKCGNRGYGPKDARQVLDTFSSEHACSERSRAPGFTHLLTRAPRGRPHRRVRHRRRGAATEGLASATASLSAPRRRLARPRGLIF